MSKIEDLRAKAAHYRELATLVDEEHAIMCRALADQYEEEAAAIEAQPNSLLGGLERS